MNITKTITLDLSRKAGCYNVMAKQGDRKSRFVKVILQDNGTLYTPPDGVTAQFRCEKPDGTSILNPAQVMEDGSVLIELTDQTLAVPGRVTADVSLMDADGGVLSAASFIITVEPAPFGLEMESSNEVLFLIQLIEDGQKLIDELREGGVPDEKIGQAVKEYLEENPVTAKNEPLTFTGAVEATYDGSEAVSVEVPDFGGNVDEAVAKYLTENPVSGGMTKTEKNLILQLFRNAAYTSAGMGAVLTQLEALWSGGGEEPDVPDVPVDPEKTLEIISVSYSGGDVEVGTAVSDLTGIVVTAHYSDGTSEAVTGYTLSGTIAEGSNTITVSYGGKTTTFTVTGVAEEEEVSNETKWTNGVAYTYEPVLNSYVNNPDGGFVEYNNWDRTPHLYCAGASKLRFQMVLTTSVINGSGNERYNAFYDADKNFIQNFSFDGLDGSTEGAYFDVDIPANVAYFIVSHKRGVIAPDMYHDRHFIDIIPYE